jgi:opacity protein-like surface antigen
MKALIAAATAAVLMSSVALAADQAAPQGSDESCATLQTKFDKDVMTAQSTNVGQAQSKREQGAKLCSEGRTAEGIAKLKEAIGELKAAAPAKPQT